MAISGPLLDDASAPVAATCSIGEGRPIAAQPPREVGLGSAFNVNAPARYARCSFACFLQADDIFAFQETRLRGPTIAHPRRALLGLRGFERRVDERIVNTRRRVVGCACNINHSFGQWQRRDRIWSMTIQFGGRTHTTPKHSEAAA